MEQLYGGYVVREYFCSDDDICQTRAQKKISVKAASEEAAELLILQEYFMNQKEYTPNRTSDKFPADKIIVNIEKIVG